MKVDVSSIGTKFENFVQAGCRDLGSHRSRNVYCRKPIILPNLVLFFGTFLELPVLTLLNYKNLPTMWQECEEDVSLNEDCLNVTLL